jgi:hypothetical protein
MLKNIFSWGSNNIRTAKKGINNDEIRPIMVDPELLNPVSDDTEERKLDELEIEKLETYYYKDAD